MSRAGRTQKFADGRQSRSNSRVSSNAGLDQEPGASECEISSVSIIKSPKQSSRKKRQLDDREISMDRKMSKMQEDMAKA